MNNELKTNNAGFSLVELIVAVLITGIMMLAVSSFLGVSRNAYQIVSKSASLQEESMTVERVLQEFLKEAKEIGTLPNQELVTGQYFDVLWIKAPKNDDTVKKNLSGEDLAGEDLIYFFVLDKAAKELRYCYGESTLVNSSGVLQSKGLDLIKSKCTGSNAKYWLIAEHVKSIFYTSGASVKQIEGADKSVLICMPLQYSFSDTSADYDNTLTVVSRNIKK